MDSHLKSDIDNHIEILKNFADRCTHITEMGVRGLHSTRVFLSTKPKTLISYDWDKPPFEVDRNSLKDAYTYSKEHDIDFRFVVANTIDTIIEKTDLLYIDTWHTYEQLLLELLLHSSKVLKYIVIHDTNELVFPGMTCAIEDFTNLNPQWSMEYMLLDLPGITVLENIASSNEVNFGHFTENELREEIQKQTKLYYKQYESNVGSTDIDWINYTDSQRKRFADVKRWPKTNSLR